MSRVGPIGRLGAWSATHGRIIAVVWVALIVGLGALAPQVESALSGAGWEDSGSESVEVRELARDAFDGNASTALTVVVASETLGVDDPAFSRTIADVQARLTEHESIASVQGPDPARGTLSADGRTAIVLGGAGDDPTEMVRAADDLKGELAARRRSRSTVDPSPAPRACGRTSTRPTSEAMLKSELISWPVTLAILVLAFGALVAAGLPLMLTILGLVASAGSLVLAAQFVDVSIWAMNFALMFALALGIDYALFIVVRFRGGAAGVRAGPGCEAVAVTMDTAGKAVLLLGR